MSTWWVTSAWASGGGIAVFSVVFWVLLSISLHELGHGVAAIWEGDDTPRRLNRMTLNPIVHMGLISLGLFALLGFAFGVMPVNRARFRHGHLGDALVAVAGPAVNLILAALVSLMYGMVLVYWPEGGDDALRAKVVIFLEKGLLLNCLLMILNLIPLPPFDGASILGGLFAPARRLYAMPEFQQFSFFGLIAVFMFASYLWEGAYVMARFLLSSVVWILP